MTAPDAVTAAWDELVAHWDDQARHDTLLGLVAPARLLRVGGEPVQDARR